MLLEQNPQNDSFEVSITWDVFPEQIVRQIVKNLQPIHETD